MFQVVKVLAQSCGHSVGTREPAVGAGQCSVVMVPKPGIVHSIAAGPTGGAGGAAQQRVNV